MKNILLILMLLPLLSIGQIIRNNPNTTSVGKVYVGNDTTNSTRFEVDGSMRALGDATCYDDLTVSGITFASGVQAPSIRQIGTTGNYAACFNYQTANDVAYYSLQMSHSYAVGTDVSPHIHYTLETTGAVGDTIVLQMIYTWTNIDDTINNATTSTYKIPVAGKVKDVHYIFENGDLNGTGKGFSSQFLYTITRLQNSASDTYNSWFCLQDLDIHYQVDSFGTREEYIK